ncbi:MAG: hypothetical protein OXC30_04975 [Alphaproteobacteria bacterium]|nr:hypothetical protein [Alphaproteobacteria bacterium]
MISFILIIFLYAGSVLAGTDGALREALKPVEDFIVSDLSRIVMLSGCGLYAWRAWSEGNPMGLVGAGAIALAAQSLFQYIQNVHPCLM